MRSLTLPALLALSLALSAAVSQAAELNTRTRIFGIPEATDRPVTDRLIVKYRNGDTAYLHHPEYDFNDDVIPHGVSYWVNLAETALAG